MASLKVYQMITDRMVDQITIAIKDIENGNTNTAPWNKPWHMMGTPTNLVTKKPYRGINIFLLSAMGFPTPYFVTFNQTKNMGFQVKKGEKGCPVVFWKPMINSEDKDGNPITDKHGNPTTKKSFMLRYTTAFNVSQTTIPEDKIPQIEKREFNPIEAAEQIIHGMPLAPTMEFGGDRACYFPSTDIVRLPPQEYFKTDHYFYSVAFHELAHSTGHQSRLARKEVMELTGFGSHSYSVEELVAEMTAVFLCNESGIENETTTNNSVAYLMSWLRSFKNDPKMIVTAAGRAQKAADFILGTETKYRDPEKEKTDKITEKENSEDSGDSIETD